MFYTLVALLASMLHYTFMFTAHTLNCTGTGTGTGTGTDTGTGTGDWWLVVGSC